MKSFIVFVLFIVLSQQATWYVQQGKKGSGTSINDPIGSIKEVVKDLLADGDTIQLMGSFTKDNCGIDGTGKTFTVDGATTGKSNAVVNCGNNNERMGFIKAYGRRVIPQSITVQNLTIKKCQTSCLYFNEIETATVTRVTFQSNEGAQGNSIYSTIGSLVVSNCIFERNDGAPEGAIFAHRGEVTITGNTFNDNLAAHGSAMYLQAGNGTITDNIFVDNNSQQAGTLYLGQSTGTYFLTGNTFRDNYSDDEGGAIYAYRSTIELEDNTIQYNAARLGGGIFCQNSAMQFTSNLLCCNEEDDLTCGAGIPCFFYNDPDCTCLNNCSTFPCTCLRPKKLKLMQFQFQNSTRVARLKQRLTSSN